MGNYTLDAYASFKNDEAKQVEKDKEDLKKTWGELILKGIEGFKKEL
jgi:hypothetical protein